jgi:hypothetical protein
MTPRPPGGRFTLLLLLLLAAASPAVNPKNRSASSSGQFVIYCDDRQARSRIVSFVEEVKSDVLRLMHEGDDWKFPVVVTLHQAAAQSGRGEPVIVALANTPAGPKVDINVRIGDDPAKIFLQRHVVRALLLEIAYRDRPPIKAGDRYTEPPWWLAEGIVQAIRSRNGNGEPDIFKSIVNTDRLPPLEKFLVQQPLHLDDAAGAIDRACSLALVEALLHLPKGPENLGRFLRASPDAADDPLAALTRNFPALSDSPQSLAKWWTLQLAGLAKSGQWQGLSAAASDAEITPLLTLDVPVDKAGRTQRFALADFAKFIHLPAAKAVLRTAQVRIVTLGTRANALYHPILAEYEQIFRLLGAGKTKGIAGRIADMERYRLTLLQRLGQITDYVNWYEATQTPGATGQFEKYLRTVESLASKAESPEPADPKISDYLNSLERDFAPFRPDMAGGQEPAGNARR